VQMQIVDVIQEIVNSAIRCCPRRLWEKGCCWTRLNQ
jgi:hypothetical protein